MQAPRMRVAVELGLEAGADLGQLALQRAPRDAQRHGGAVDRRGPQRAIEVVAQAAEDRREAIDSADELARGRVGERAARAPNQRSAWLAEPRTRSG